MLAVPFLIGCLDRTPETYHSVGIRRGTATSNFHLQRDNLHLSASGHKVGLVDSFARRGYDTELGATSLVPIVSLEERVEAWRQASGTRLATYIGDLTDPASRL